MRSYSAVRLAWARRKRSTGISCPLIVATTFGLAALPLSVLVPKYTADVAMKARMMMTRMNFRLLKYSRMLLITVATSQGNRAGAPPAI